MNAPIATGGAAPAAAPSAPSNALPGTGTPPPAPVQSGSPSNMRDRLAQHRANQANQPPLPSAATRADDGPVSPQDLFQSRSQFDEVVNPDPNAAAPDPSVTPEQQAQADAAVERMLHGMKADEVIAALEAGEVPEALWDKLKIRQKINGEDVPVTLKEYRENGMRISDYTRKTQELASERTAHQERVQHFDSILTSWGDPKSAAETVQAMNDMGLPLEQIVEHYAAERVAEMQLERNARNPNAPPEMRAMAQQLLEQKRALKAERQKARQQQMEQARSQQTQTSQQREQAVAQAQTLIKTELPNMFVQAGIKDTPHAREVLRSFLAPMLDGKPLTRDVLAQGIQATREHLSDLAKAHAAANGGNVSQLRPGGAAPGGAPQPQAQDRRPSSFRDHINSVRGRG